RGRGRSRLTHATPRNTGRAPMWRPFFLRAPEGRLREKGLRSALLEGVLTRRSERSPFSLPLPAGAPIRRNTNLQSQVVRFPPVIHRLVCNARVVAASRMETERQQQADRNDGPAR